MARDNHPRVRQKAKLERKKAKRASYDRVLIVCEGKKTEPQYFEEIRQFYRLNSTNVQIVPSTYGTTPQQVINYARDKLKQTLEWERVFCVFDRDEHQNFSNALSSAKSLNKKFTNELGEPIELVAIPSIPCFELWLLLHFVSVTKEMHRDEVLRKLRHPERLAKYEKGRSGSFEKTRNQLHVAFTNAELLAKERARHSTENPYTDVGKLVKFLMGLN